MPLSHVSFMADWYDRLVSRTNEKMILPDAIQSLLPSPHASCLEIGLGTSPFFASKLGSLFSRYVIVEKEIDLDVVPEGIEFVKIDWESFETDERFDVIIASHVLYYFRDKKAAVEKMLEHLTENGRVLFVVNGKDGDYGPLKNAFSNLSGYPYVFTYDELTAILEGVPYEEVSVPSTVAFSSPEDLFETLRLSFDQYPEEYETHKSELLRYFKDTLPNGTFTINQKIFAAKRRTP